MGKKVRHLGGAAGAVLYGLMSIPRMAWAARPQPLYTYNARQWVVARRRVGGSVLVGLLALACFGVDAGMAEAHEPAVRVADGRRGSSSMEVGLPDFDEIEPTMTQVDGDPPPSDGGGPIGSIDNGSGIPRAAELPDGWAVVEVHHDGDRVAAEAAVSAVGGTTHGAAGNSLIEAEVPIDAISAIEDAPHVTYVTAPNVTGPEAGQAVVGGEVAAVNADDWHAAGITGAGVKVGIIDSFDAYAWWDSTVAGDLSGGPAGTFCQAFGEDCEIWEGLTAHGTAVAEIVHEMAPSAQLYIATTYTTADFQAAIDYFADQGVKIVTQSRTAEYDGPGNGTGPVAEVIDSAISQGMVYINAAGNSAGSTAHSGSYWRGAWSDPDNDGWLNFGPGDEQLNTICWYFNGFRWSDWGPNPTDYDVYLYDENGVFEGVSDYRQVDGAPPIEHLNTIDCSILDPVGIRVRRHATGAGTAGDVLELMTNGAPVEYWQSAYSASGPMVDSANPGSLAVGAVDLPNVTSIASYSSQGPTNDGRIKPDVTGTACIATALSSSCFRGTSAAAPSVAGALALAVEGGAASTPSGLTAWLKARATDRGTTGADNVFGAGVLQMLPPGAGAPLTSITALVDRQYLDFLDRAPTATERNTWRRRLLVATTYDRAKLVASLRTTTDNLTHVDPVARLYWAFLGRHPDHTGLLYWVDRKRTGYPFINIANFMTTTGQYADLYGGTTNTQFVNAVYQNVLQRTADASGLTHWVGQLNSGSKTRAQVLSGIAESDEGKAKMAKRVNVGVIPTLMLHLTLSTASVSSLVTGAATSADLAQWAFTHASYPI